MNRLRFLIKAIRAIRAGRLGDGAAYKAVALTAPAYPATAQQLDRLAQPFRPLTWRLCGRCRRAASVAPMPASWTTAR